MSRVFKKKRGKSPAELDGFAKWPREQTKSLNVSQKKPPVKKKKKIDTTAPKICLMLCNARD